MKLPGHTHLKIAALVAFFVFAAAGSAMAQGTRIQTSHLDYLTAKASTTVDVNIDERLIQLTAKFLSNKNPDEAKVREVVNGLKGIYVRSFQFEKEGEYALADLESIRSQLRGPGWSKIVNVSSKKEGNIEVYLMISGSQIGGLAVLASDPKELTVVNLIGPVDLEKLTQLEGQFGIPELEIEQPNTTRKV